MEPLAGEWISLKVLSSEKRLYDFKLPRGWCIAADQIHHWDQQRAWTANINGLEGDGGDYGNELLRSFL